MISEYNNYRSVLDEKFDSNRLSYERYGFMMDKLMEWDLAPEAEIQVHLTENELVILEKVQQALHHA